jgi:NADPH2:quinone reductase
MLGFASGEIPRLALNLVLLKGVVVKGFEIRTFPQHDPVHAERDRTELLALFEEGRVRPYISESYPLAEARTALESLAERRATGKVVIRPWA